MSYSKVNSYVGHKNLCIELFIKHWSNSKFVELQWELDTPHRDDCENDIQAN
jgi:hypothetical protein